MKIQLDTENKTIKLEHEVKLSTLVETLEKLLPDGLWKEFTLQANTIITHWSSPIVIREIDQSPHRVYPWYDTTYLETKDNMLLAKGDATDLLKGSYNIEA